MKKLLFTALCLVVVVITTNAQSNQKAFKRGQREARSIEKNIKEIKDHLLKCTVALDHFSGSGVLVSEDGYILTAAHVLDAYTGSEIWVKLYNGKYYKATPLGMDVKSDYGLIKIEGEEFEYAEMGSSSELAKDEACVMLGFPNRKLRRDRSAMVRVGFVHGTSNDPDGFLGTSCIVMRGDSGGPLFNLEGKLIGINCAMQGDLEENFFAPVDRIKKNWKKLLKTVNDNPYTFNSKSNKGDNYDPYSAYECNTAPSMKKPFVIEGGKKGLTQIINKAAKITQNPVVKIKSIVVGRGELEVYGTIVGKEGYILSKSSCVGEKNLYCELPTGNQVNAEIIGRDQANDLVLIKIEAGMLSPVDMDKAVHAEVGQLLGTIGTNGKVICSGLLGVETMNIPKNIFTKIKTKTKSDGFNTKHISSYEDVSRRRCDFPAVFVHDMPLRLNEYGSPVVNLKGEVIGINIAREDRTGSLAIPIDKVAEVVRTIIESPKKSEVITDVEGNVYKTVKIGEQWWMAENLRTTKYSDGTDIPLVTDNSEWANLETPAYCWYDNNESYKDTYGALYNHYTVNTKLCPTGWHIPHKEEWQDLLDFLGVKNMGQLKEAGTAHWNTPNNGATNETGFNALPGGAHDNKGNFLGLGKYTYWWSTTAQSGGYWAFYLHYYFRGHLSTFDQKSGFSVRCVKNI